MKVSILANGEVFQTRSADKSPLLRATGLYIGSERLFETIDNLDKGTKRMLYPHKMKAQDWRKYYNSSNLSHC